LGRGNRGRVAKLRPRRSATRTGALPAISYEGPTPAMPKLGHRAQPGAHHLRTGTGALHTPPLFLRLVRIDPAPPVEAVSRRVVRLVILNER
jgi:hypothetical protein